MIALFCASVIVFTDNPKKVALIFQMSVCSYLRVHIVYIASHPLFFIYYQEQEGLNEIFVVDSN